MTSSSCVTGIAAILAGEHDGVPPEVNVPALASAAVEQGVDGLLWQRLEGGGAQHGLRELLYPGVRAAVTREIFVQRELQAVCTALQRACVPALVTKGAALAYTVYPEPWLRPRLDTDLFVRAADLEAVTVVLEALGYARSAAISTGEHVSHQRAFDRVDSDGMHYVLDVHWKLANPQVLAEALAFDTLWPESQSVPAIGARVPSTVASLALACVHRLAHHQGHERLVWLYDMVLLARQLDSAGWQTLTDLAERQGIAAVCLDGLRVARLMGLDLPHDVEQRLAAAAPRERSRVYVVRRVTRHDVLLSDLAHLGTWRARLRLLREHVFPPSAFMRQRYGSSSRWPLPALYLHRFVTGAARWSRS